MRTCYVVESISMASLVSRLTAGRFAPGLVVAKAEERGGISGSQPEAMSRPGIEVLGIHGHRPPGA
jgi:hypothetical protein